MVEASAMEKENPERRMVADASFYDFLDIGSGVGPLLFGTLAPSAGCTSALLPSVRPCGDVDDHVVQGLA